MNTLYLLGSAEITPTRYFNYFYIIIDTVFIIILLSLLLWKKKKDTFIFAIFGGVLYFLVDFGYFYLISKSRTIAINNEVVGSFKTALILLWMSLSYGITNFAYIWLLIKKDADRLQFVVLIIGWWIVAPTISSLGDSNVITTMRTTGSYHGFMGIILVIGYLILIINNLKLPIEKRTNIIWLNIIGISVQFAWEFALLINGIRPFTDLSIKTLLINSFIETNLGMPIIFGIYKIYSKRMEIKNAN